MKGKTKVPIYFLAFLFLLGCSARKVKFEKDTNSDYPLADTQKEIPSHLGKIKWGLPIPLMQLVTETVLEENCPSGWTEIYKKFKAENKEKLIPLQPDYVKRFADLGEFNEAMSYAFPLVKSGFSTIRLTLVWPCFKNPLWQKKIQQTIEYLQNTLGAEIELTLFHHDSYPAILETASITTSGFANENAVAEFENYTTEVIKILEGKIPKNTTIYLANEPMGYLFNAYLGPGTWPPGGKMAGKTMTKAMVNMCEAFYRVAQRLKDAGYKVAIAQNIRPVLNKESQAAKTLDYIFNWWLIDALLFGCRDDDFDGKCEETKNPAPVDILGITFYGTMRASENTVKIGLSQNQEIEMSLPEYDFAPNYLSFEEALNEVTNRFENVEVGVAEIGFSAVEVSKMAYWLISYKKVVEDLQKSGKIKNVPFIQLHSLFECAEFSPGEWVFHLVGRCDEEGCSLTEWGQKVLEIILEKN